MIYWKTKKIKPYLIAHFGSFNLEDTGFVSSFSFSASSGPDTKGFPLPLLSFLCCGSPNRNCLHMHTVRERSDVISLCARLIISWLLWLVNNLLTLFKQSNNAVLSTGIKWQSTSLACKLSARKISLLNSENPFEWLGKDGVRHSLMTQSKTSTATNKPSFSINRSGLLFLPSTVSFKFTSLKYWCKNSNTNWSLLMTSCGVGDTSLPFFCLTIRTCVFSRFCTSTEVAMFETMGFTTCVISLLPNTLNLVSMTPRECMAWTVAHNLLRKSSGRDNDSSTLSWRLTDDCGSVHLISSDQFSPKSKINCSLFILHSVCKSFNTWKKLTFLIEFFESQTYKDV